MVAAYLTLDSGRIPRGWTVGSNGTVPPPSRWISFAMPEFFLLEAGFIGVAILAIRRSSQVVLALAVLALLPLVSFGAANDFVMRVSIPSLTVLAIAACLALTETASNRRPASKKVVLGCTARGRRGHAASRVRARRVARALAHQSSTPRSSEPRAASIPPHYVARLRRASARRIFCVQPQPLPLGPGRRRRARIPRCASDETNGVLRKSATTPRRAVAGYMRAEDSPSCAAGARARRRLLRMHFESRIGHLGGNLSALDALITLHHRVMGPTDRFILSKGHAAGALYITLWSLGLLARRSLRPFTPTARCSPAIRCPGWSEHIPFATGSLGHGFPVALGMALARHLNGEAGPCLLPHLGRRMAGGRDVGGVDFLGAPHA